MMYDDRVLSQNNNSQYWIFLEKIGDEQVP